MNAHWTKFGAALLVAAAALACTGGRGEGRARGGEAERFDEPADREGKGKARKARAAAEGAILVSKNGEVSEPLVTVKPGETVQWRLSDRRDAIVAGKPREGKCHAPVEWSEGALAGPSPVAPSGVFVIGPFSDELGLERREACKPVGRADERRGVALADGALCPVGDGGASFPATWTSPLNTGVHVRLMWNVLEPSRGKYDWTHLDRELDQAVASGKLVSLSVKAGAQATPDWIFSAGVQRLQFQDSGSKGKSCGTTMDLGDPTTPAFRALWGEMLDALGAHVQSRADWFRSVAYVRVGGANLHSAEARLPNRCKEDCSVCNTEVWARSGYRPSKLYDFFDWQEARIAALFPGKSGSLQLIQAGFPRVDEQGCWMVGEEPKTRTKCLDGSTRAGDATLPKGAEQTQALIDRALDKYAPTFQIAHNGLGPIAASARCPTFGRHPARGPYANASDGCPNKWVLEAGGRRSDQITGFQTNNEGGVANLTDLESTFGNLWDNSDGVVLEIYEDLFLEHVVGNKPLPSGKTIGDWDERLHQRREQISGPKTPDPFPESFEWKVPADAKEGSIHWYVPWRCDGGKGAQGEIRIER